MSCAHAADLVAVLAWSLAACLAALILTIVFVYALTVNRQKQDVMLAINGDLPPQLPHARKACRR